MVLTVSFVLSPVTGLLSPSSLKKLASQELDASVGASGPHDFAVRKLRRSSSRALASTASHPNVRDDGQRPLVRDETALNKPVIWVRRK
jgi:hypothetical protein